jgi:hypothetical protein
MNFRVSWRIPPAVATAERPAFGVGEPSPNAFVLTRCQGESQTLLSDRAVTAYGFGSVDLLQGAACGPDREEQLRVFGAARRAVTPVGH